MSAPVLAQRCASEPGSGDPETNPACAKAMPGRPSINTPTRTATASSLLRFIPVASRFVSTSAAGERTSSSTPR